MGYILELYWGNCKVATGLGLIKGTIGDVGTHWGDVKVILR